MDPKKITKIQRALEVLKAARDDYIAALADAGLGPDLDDIALIEDVRQLEAKAEKALQTEPA
jgi:hypothetical protein